MKARKLSNLFAGSAAALVVGVLSFATISPAFAEFVKDGETTPGVDLNSASGEVSQAELVEVSTDPILELEVGNEGVAASVLADGTATPLDGDYTLPSEMDLGVDRGAIVTSNSYLLAKSNNSSGFTVSLMMCTNAAAAPFALVTDCAPSQNLVARTAAHSGTGSAYPTADAATIDTSNTTSYFAPVSANLSTEGASATSGGVWGYSSNAVADGETALTAGPAVTATSFKPVPAFTATKANNGYGDILKTTNNPGAAAVNVAYGVYANHNLAAGIYANYVIYSLVANPVTPAESE
jgi:hypothetical protein